YDIAQLASATAGFSGAEIEQTIVSAMHDSFFAGREVTNDDILASIRETIPLSTTMRERISDLREWAKSRARSVTTMRHT
ncbi:MAG TPA: ATPase, partial [Candidatus Hydrogenedentes bacterium]|nr:ATPase [Candidatus Hydrogenedentota bacterium]